MGKAEDFQIDETTLARDYGSGSAIEIPQGVETIAAGFLLHDYLISYDNLFDIPDIQEREYERQRRMYDQLKRVEEVMLPDGLREIGGVSNATIAGTGIGAFAGAVNLKHIKIPDTVTHIGPHAFAGCGLTEITLPEGITEICDETFMGCRDLKRVTLPKSLKRIGDRAFCGCFHLSSIHIPEGTEIGTDAFRYCASLTGAGLGPGTLDAEEWERIGFTEEKNGCVVKDGELVKYVGNPVHITISEGVRRIPRGSILPPFVFFVFPEGTPVQSCRLPASLEQMEEQGFINLVQKASASISMNLPAGYLKTRERLTGPFTLQLLNGPWKELAQAEDYAALYLFQSRAGKHLMGLCEEKLINAPEETAKAFARVLKDEAKPAQAERAVAFVVKYKEEISRDAIRALAHVLSGRKGMAKAVKALDSLMVPGAEETSALSEEEQPSEAAEKQPDGSAAEEFLLDQALKNYEAAKEAWKGVRLTDGKEAPALLVKQAIVPYLEQFPGRPKKIGDYKRAFFPLRFIEEADAAAGRLDKRTFQEALEKLYNASRKDQSGRRQAWLLPYARFGSGAQIASLIAVMNQWKKYGGEAKMDVIIARSALLLSDTKEAVLYLDKEKNLSVYADMRGRKADEVREQVLMDFGLDAAGRKEYDLGGKIIQVSLEKDLTLRLFETAAGRSIKSIPKKGVDEALAAAAAEDFSEMKKNVRKAVKAQSSRLMEDFLTGIPMKAEDWKQRYLENPLMLHLARLLVWSQDGETFTIGEDGAVDAAGDCRMIKDTPVCVAHPIEMGEEETKAWQKYFASRGLRQPFLQVWEPIIPRDSIQPDRYASCAIPLYRLKDQERHGIFMKYHPYNGDEIGHWEGTIEGCMAQIRQETYGTDAADITFSIPTFRFTKYQARRVNHVAAYLDWVTVYDSIVKDEDARIAGQLGEFTLAQITEFIQAAIGHGSSRCLALLMDYKNKAFGEYDPMEEFVL